MRAALPGFGLLLALTPSLAFAETPAENKAAARALALEGLELAANDRCDEAIPLFERAEALFHAPTILVHLGECQLRLGRLVEGTETLRGVVREELPASAPKAFIEAQAKARTLLEEAQPKIATLVIQVEPADVPDLQVTVNDVVIAPALIGAPRPTDPGSHRIAVRAPGYQTEYRTITLDEGGSETIELCLQPIESKTPRAPQPVDEVASPSSSRRTIGYVGIGLGGALLAVGGITGALALKGERDLDQRCHGGVCPASEQDALDSARTFASVSTITSIAGAAIGVTGLILLLTDPSRDEGTPTARQPVTPWLGVGSVGVSGAF